MAKDILHLKPNFYGLGMDLNEIYRRLKEGRGAGHDVSVLAARFLRLFAEHGVRPTSIPHLVPDLRYKTGVRVETGVRVDFRCRCS